MSKKQEKNIVDVSEMIITKKVNGKPVATIMTGAAAEAIEANKKTHDKTPQRQKHVTSTRPNKPK